jgi:hypothetical protein
LEADHNKKNEKTKAKDKDMIHRITVIRNNSETMTSTTNKTNTTTNKDEKSVTVITPMVKELGDKSLKDLEARAKAITARELEIYAKRTAGSKRAIMRARKVLPLGVPSSFQAYDPHPIVVRHSAGSRMVVSLLSDLTQLSSHFVFCIRMLMAMNTSIMIWDSVHFSPVTCILRSAQKRKQKKLFSPLTSSPHSVHSNQ